MAFFIKPILTLAENLSIITPTKIRKRIVKGSDSCALACFFTNEEVVSIQ